MLLRSLSKPTWCPKSTIATAVCTASQINYWIILSEFRTMLLDITPALATLHWLPVNRRIDFKIAFLVYKTLNGQAAAYDAHLLQPYAPPRKQLLSQPPCRLKSYGDRAFWCAAPVVWNNIPHIVKTAKTVDSFKVKLKTHFYSALFA